MSCELLSFVPASRIGSSSNSSMVLERPRPLKMISTLRQQSPTEDWNLGSQDGASRGDSLRLMTAHSSELRHYARKEDSSEPYDERQPGAQGAIDPRLCSSFGTGLKILDPRMAKNGSMYLPQLWHIIYLPLLWQMSTITGGENSWLAFTEVCVASPVRL